MGSISLALTKSERDAINRSLQDRRSRLLEKTGDTSQTAHARMAAREELNRIASAIAKLSLR